MHAPNEDADKQTDDTSYNTIADIIWDIKGDNEIHVLEELRGRIGKEEHTHIVNKYGESIQKSSKFQRFMSKYVGEIYK